MADFPLHTNTGPWLGSWLAAIFENIKIKMKAHVWAKILRQENFQAGFPHCLRDRTIATLYLRNCLFNCTQRVIIALSASSESHHPFMCRRSPVCTQAPNWLHLGTPSASEDHFKIYYSRPWGQAPHKRQEQSENLLEMCSPLILGVATIHVV